MSRFSLLSLWTFDAPIDKLWQALFDTASWPTWWRYVEQVDAVETGDVEGVGSRWRLVWRTALLYKLAFDVRVVRVQAPHALDAEAIGELRGMGRWRLAESAQGTEVRYHWDVSITKPWMNWIAPVAAPAFRWNHERVMAEGGRGLAHHLNARLVRAESKPLAVYLSN